jgi:hypothetical protein
MTAMYDVMRQAIVVYRSLAVRHMRPQENLKKADGHMEEKMMRVFVLMVIERDDSSSTRERQSLPDRVQNVENLHKGD